MIKRRVLAIAFLFHTLFNPSYCQPFHLPQKVHDVIRSLCAVCKANQYYASRKIAALKGFTSAEVAYHNAVYSLGASELDDSYQYFVQEISLGTAQGDTLYYTARFLQAKILFVKGLFSKALDMYLPLLRQKWISELIKENICTNIAEIYLEQNKFSESLQYFSLWKKNYEPLSNPNSIKSVFCNIGLCYLHTGQFKVASVYFGQSIAIAEQQKDTSGLAVLYENIANQYYNQYLDAVALRYFTKSLRYARLANNIEVQKNVYGSLAAIAESQKQFAKALQYQKQYKLLNDSIYNRDNIYNLGQQEKKLAAQESDRKMKIARQQNALVRQRNQLQTLALIKKNLQLTVSVILGVSFLSFFLFALYAYLQKNRQNKIISAQREQLDSLNRTKDQLFSIVAHDLRSPVQTLKLTQTRLRTALMENDVSKAEQISGEIENLSNSTYSLLNNLLYWTLSQTGQLCLANDQLNVKRIVEMVYHDYLSVAAAKDITLKNAVPEHLYCSGDLNTIKVIFRNLLDNAIKFSESCSVVVVSAAVEGKECIISVSDKGEGIDESVIEALFNSSNRRVNGSHTGSQSTGIGLWLAKAMAERNGGSMHIQRETKGTTISIRLPQYRNHGQVKDTHCRRQAGRSRLSAKYFVGLPV